VPTIVHEASACALSPPRQPLLQLSTCAHSPCRLPLRSQRNLSCRRVNRCSSCRHAQHTPCRPSLKQLARNRALPHQPSLQLLACTHAPCDHHSRACAARAPPRQLLLPSCRHMHTHHADHPSSSQCALVRRCIAAAVDMYAHATPNIAHAASSHSRAAASTIAAAVDMRNAPCPDSNPCRQCALTQRRTNHRSSCRHVRTCHADHCSCSQRALALCRINHRFSCRHAHTCHVDHCSCAAGARSRGAISTLDPAADMRPAPCRPLLMHPTVASMRSCAMPTIDHVIKSCQHVPC